MNATLKIQGALKLQGYIKFSFSEVSNWISTLNRYGLPLPSDTVINALYNLVKNLYATNLRSKILRLNLFCGGDYRGSFFPVIKDIGGVWDYNGIYGSTPSALASGPFQAENWDIINGFNAMGNNIYQSGGSVTGNTNTNTLKIIDTTVSESDPILSNYSMHLACLISGVNNSSNITTNCSDMGGTNYLSLQCALAGNSPNNNVIRYNCYSQAAGSGDIAGGYVNLTNYSPTGFYVGSRYNSNLITIYKNGGTSAIPLKANGVNPNNSAASSGPYSGNSTSITVFCKPLANVTNAPAGASSKNLQNVTDRTMSMYSIGLGLSDVEVATYNTLIANFNTAIGRTNF
jgi:hypothetical protein